MTLPTPLLDAAKQRRLVPFVGAGFSRVFSLPTWNELIDQVALHTGFDPDVARLYGDFLQLAEYLYIQQHGLGKLRSELDRVFNASAIDVSKSAAHMLLPQLNSPAIYTTNWDELIERAFDTAKVPYNKIVAAHDIAQARHDRTSIVKFHGDFSGSDAALVFTESSYFERLNFESPLDILLRAEMLGSTLLFLGYSLSDINVRFMWFKLQKLLAQQKSPKKSDPFAYIVTAQRNPVFEDICKHSRDIGVLFLDTLDPQKSMVELLQTIADYVKTT